MHGVVHTECLDESTVICFLRGELDRDSSLAVESHLDGCEPCRELIVALARGDFITKRLSRPRLALTSRP